MHREGSGVMARGIRAHYLADGVDERQASWCSNSYHAVHAYLRWWSKDESHAPCWREVRVSKTCMLAVMGQGKKDAQKHFTSGCDPWEPLHYIFILCNINTVIYNHVDVSC